MFGGVHQASLVTKGAAFAAGAASAAIGGSLGDMPSLTAAAGGAGVLAGYAGWAEYDNKLNRKVGALDAAGETMFMQTAMSSLV